jgi:diguanylate cyclase (GGDEF)-like protein
MNARSNADPLTGLGHARAFDERLSEVTAQHTRHAVLSIDVDHLELVNETLGRDAGDSALRAVADAMHAALRMDDCLFRTGGDEFAVVVPVRDEGDAMRIADRIQRATRRVGHPVSIGIAVSEPGVLDQRELFARADVALRSVKRRGCNGTSLAHPRRHDTLVR